MLALCSTWWCSTVYNSLANKGCYNQIFCLVALINILGMDLTLVLVMHLFTIMPRRRLWCSACSTRHVTTSDGILFVHLSTVMTEFLGMQTGFFFDPIVTCPVCLVLLPKFCWSFFKTNDLSLGDLLVQIAGRVLVDTPNPLPSLVSEWW